MTDTIDIRVPARFFEDRLDRGLDTGAVLKRTKRYVDVQINRAQFDDLISDADYYADRDLGPELAPIGVVHSARAALRWLEGVEPPAAKGEAPRPPCDYCGEHPIATDYGACAECESYHDDPDNANGPTLYRNGRKLAKGSAEYEEALTAIALSI